MDSNLFNNPAFANLSPEKLQFLLSFAQKEKPLNMKDAMPFLLSNMRQAKENHIDFTKPEIELLCDLLSKDLPPESQTQMKKIKELLDVAAQCSHGACGFRAPAALFFPLLPVSVGRFFLYVFQSFGKGYQLSRFLQESVLL